MTRARLMTRPEPHSDNIEEAAALWFARMSSELKTPEDQGAFDAWLAESPDHVDAYAEMCELDTSFDVLERKPDLAAYRVEAQLIEEQGRRPLLARLGLPALATLSAIAAAAAGFMYLSAASVERNEWSTARGEIREITLSDGTEAVLGSDTHVEIAFRDNQRLFTIDRGQVFFDVAHDADRPFIAATGGRTVTALGTAFDVRSFQNDLTVTLVRGSVAVADRGAPPDAVLTPGQQYHSAFGVTSVRDVDADAEVSWRTGVFDFDNVPLSEAVARFNRSASRSIVLADPSLGELRVSGVFRADDPAGFAAALAPAYPIRVLPQRSGDVLIERNSCGVGDNC